MNKEERKLTPAEEKRKAAFEEICEKMEGDGYERKDLTVSVLQANIMAIVTMLPFALVAGWIFYAFTPSRSTGLSPGVYLLFLLLLILLVILHEGIHGLTWGICAKNHFHSISFGVIWKWLTPYCTCCEPLKKWQYILGSAMPTLILGFGLAAAATIGGSFWLFFLAEVMIFSGGGDFFIIFKMLKYRPKDKTVFYFDHPYECGLVAFEKKK